MTACIVQVCMWSIRFACNLCLRKQKSWSRTEADLEVGLPGSRRLVENWAWEVLSTVSDFPNYFDLLYLLPIPGSGHGYHRDDDTLGEDEERSRNRIVTNG